MMSMIEDLRDFINKEHEKRKGEIQTVVTKYFEDYFIACHKPWRAMVTKNKCVTEPFTDDILGVVFIGEDTHTFGIKWPDLSEEEIRKCLISLGFVVSEFGFHVAVPKWKKHETLTFAQEWVKKINDNYTLYCAQEKEQARALYPEVIYELKTSSPETIHYFPEYTLFEGFKFSKEVSIECARFMDEMLNKDGIKEYYNDEDKYVGVIVRNVKNH